jgi:hypothetical protein
LQPVANGKHVLDGQTSVLHGLRQWRRDCGQRARCRGTSATSTTHQGRGLVHIPDSDRRGDQGAHGIAEAKDLLDGQTKGLHGTLRGARISRVERDIRAWRIGVDPSTGLHILLRLLLSRCGRRRAKGLRRRRAKLLRTRRTELHWRGRAKLVTPKGTELLRSKGAELLRCGRAKLLRSTRAKLHRRRRAELLTPERTELLRSKGTKLLRRRRSKLATTKIAPLVIWGGRLLTLE